MIPFQVPLAAGNVSMVIVDSTGLMLYGMSGADGAILNSLDQAYVDFLRRLGGAATFAFGNFSASLFGQSLQPPAFVVKGSTATGPVHVRQCRGKPDLCITKPSPFDLKFSQSGVIGAFQTYVR